MVYRSYLFPKSIISLPSDISLIDISEFEEDTLRELSRVLRNAQRSIDGLFYKMHTKANQLAEHGSSISGLDLALDTGQISATQARREVKQSETAVELDGLVDAVIGGLTSSEHVEAIGRQLNKLSDDERSELDNKQIVDAATKMPADTFNRHLKRLVDNIKQDHGLQDYKSKQDASEFKHWFDKKSGMGKFSGQLDPISYEAVTEAIDSHTRTLANSTDKPTSLDANLAAKAFFELVTSSDRINRRLPLINVVTDLQTLDTGFHSDTVAETSLGNPLPPETISRLSCDATISKIVLDESSIPINVGRKYRTATDSQWTATKAIYNSCAWKNCDRRLSWCQLHHIDEWTNGGPTDFENLVPLCNQHHHNVHEGKWKIKLEPDRSLNIWKPDGTLWTKAGPPSRRNQFKEIAETKLCPNKHEKNKKSQQIEVDAAA